ncbi:PaaI family thioesterase [Cumulibacter soli]|uniref:PaaI family thioesterase n=1 Tax=Cumulibacter soli TaxID=2546344 RepID=UPI001419AAF6|nr:PaaI family thioesterase [Cumulibacter soli]
MSTTIRRGLRRLIGLTVDDEQPGFATSRMTVTEDHLNGGGILHGGAIATMCDSAMGHAVGSVVAADGQGAATATLNLTFLNRAELGDELIANARVQKRGKRIVIVRATVLRPSDGTEIAEGIATFGTFDRRKR